MGSNIRFYPKYSRMPLVVGVGAAATSSGWRKRTGSGDIVGVFNFVGNAGGSEVEDAGGAVGGKERERERCLPSLVFLPSLFFLIFLYIIHPFISSPTKIKQTK